jgi:hypothetical protein
MLKELYNENMTNFLIEYLANKIMNDNVDSLDDLAIMPIARNKKELEPILSARNIMIDYIERKTNILPEKFHLNLEGYFNDLAYGVHEFPHINTLEKEYVILIDNFNDPLLTQHAHYFISKFGVPHKQIKVGTIICASETFNNMNLTSTKLVKDNNSNKEYFTEKKIKIKPDYVGLDSQYEEFNGYNPEKFKLINKNEKLFIGL